MAVEYIIVVESGTLRREVKVEGDGLIVGRGPTAHIRLPDDYASREHGRYEMRSEELWMVDLISRNGIFVNGERLMDENTLMGLPVCGIFLLATETRNWQMRHTPKCKNWPIFQTMSVYQMCRQLILHLFWLPLNPINQ